MRSHHRTASSAEVSPESTPHKEYCAIPLSGRLNQLDELNGGGLLSDPAFQYLPPLRPLEGSNPLPKGFACVNIAETEKPKEAKTEHPYLPRIPNINMMLGQTKNFNRIVSGDPKAADFSIDEISEHEFKKRYVSEILKLKDKVAPELPDTELARFTKGVYKVEDPNGTFDTQSGTPTSVARSEAPEADKFRRRNDLQHASSAIGYCQIITPTALRLMTTDKGEIAASMRGDAAQMRERDSAAAEKLENKAAFFETVQKKVNDEIEAFAKENNGRKDYFDDKGNPSETLYTAFSNSDKRTSLGYSGRELANAMQGMLLDGDVGPKVQARQLMDDLHEAMGTTPQAYFKNATLSWQKAAEKFESMSPQEQKKAITNYIKALDAKKLSDEERGFLEKKATGLAVCRIKDAPLPQDPNTCDALLRTQATDKKQPDNVLDVLKGTYCSAKDMLARNLPALGQLFNNWGADGAKKMLGQHAQNTSKLISPEALRVNSIARGVNSDGLMERINRIQSRADDYGSLELDSIFKDMSTENYYRRKNR